MGNDDKIEENDQRQREFRMNIIERVISDEYDIDSYSYGPMGKERPILTIHFAKRQKGIDASVAEIERLECEVSTLTKQRDQYKETAEIYAKRLDEVYQIVRD